MVLTGPSGEGKTTLLNIMGFLDDDFSGSIL
ncbi:ABC transporter ATP-binding protein, partial [Salmonella enterica]|nr:ABC transporter ATP-binding protein [Salmonella enterica]